MLLRCKETFVTREFGYPRTVAKGETYFKTGETVVWGGYECAVMRRVEDGRLGTRVLVRLDRIFDNFETVPLDGCA